MMKIFLVRHGETEWNLQRREMGQLDSPLTSRGVLQARALAQRLKEHQVELVCSSDLGRALETAEIIAGVCGVEVEVEPGLRERHMGIFQGLTVDEMRERYPVERAAYEDHGFDYVIPDGESARQRQERSVRVMNEIADRYPVERVAVVTHGGFLMGFFEHVLDIKPGNSWRFERRNASLNVFGYREGRWTLETWNDVSHLDAMGSLDDPMLVPTLGSKGAGDERSQ